MKEKLISSFRMSDRHRLSRGAFLFMIISLTTTLGSLLIVYRSVLNPAAYSIDAYSLCMLFASRRFIVSAIWLCLCETVGGGLLMDYVLKHDKKV
ncbi:MAG TPA: hypothetical protein DCY74_06880 [Clostridiales bacterium]|jgi:hypothetical protein|nr:hypothetical protein [Clostridiales bacterium]HCG35132.1 hypothetical protein [Clostridiales bacterium]